MRIEDLRQHLRALGAKPCHEDKIFRAWAQVRAFDSGPHPAEHFLPLKLRQALDEWLLPSIEGLARVKSTHPAEDGASRLLVELADAQTVESVLLPRGGVCVSTQLGCAVGCQFCMTGKEGLIRQLGSAEIVAQVVLARRLRKVNKVVFMGMGEPSHNLDNVIEAIEFLATEGEIGHKNLVFSTVGDRRAFERLPQARIKPALALSLHTTRDDLRRQLLPRAPHITPEELVELGEAYARATDYPIQYQWTLIDGVNDSDAEMEAVVRLLKGKYAIMNLIPYNQVEGLPYRRPDPARTAEQVRFLHRAGILTKTRQSAGQDIDGGCGQLRARQITMVRKPRAAFKAGPVADA